jgi:hypothetical protein
MISQYELLLFRNYLFYTAMNYEEDGIQCIANGFLVNDIEQSARENEFPTIISKLHPFVFLDTPLNI